jgi:PKD repeat protein
VPHPPDRRFVLLLAATFALGCSGGTDLLLPGDGEPARIEIEHGDSLRGRVGERLSDSLVFAVTDSRNRPVEGARVVFDLTAAGPGADLAPDTARTDANGKAHTSMVLGTTVGPQSGEARVLMPEGVTQPTTTFTVIALSENANGMRAVLGEDQTGPAGSVLPQPLVVQVTDAFGNPISGVPISWTVEGGGSVSEELNHTDGEGRASVSRTLGPTAGPQSTIATSATELAGSPLTFLHTATAGNASGLTIVSGNNQTAIAGTELPGDLVVRLVDAAGNGVPGAAVTWVVGTGGGRVSHENTFTDEAGRTSTRWTLGRTPGPNRVDAVVSGLGFVNFTATGTAAAPPALAILVQPAGSARNGAPLARQPVIQLRNTAGDPAAVPGVQVTAQLSGGGGELLGTRVIGTDGAGRAAFTNLAIAGAEGARRLVFTAAGYAGATSSVINVGAIGTTTTITSDSPDPSLAGAAVLVGFRVTSEGPTPTGSVTVTVSDGGATCTGTLQNGAGSCQLVMNRAGQRTIRATYNGAPGFNRSAGTEGHLVNAPAPQNRAPDADYNWHCEGLTCQFTDASEDEDGSVVAWHWNFGDGSTTTVREPRHTFPGPAEYEVTLTVRDNDGASDASVAHVRVSAPPQNQPPTAAFSFRCEDLRCDFISEASNDPDGRIESRDWSFGDGDSSDDRNPSHTYDAANTYTVTLTVTDNDGASASQSQQVTVTQTNRSPTADDDSYETNEGQTLSVPAPGVLANDSDPDGNPMTARVASGPQNGSLNLRGDGSFDYTPNGGFAGDDSFTYAVSDGQGGESTANVQIRVREVNQAPTAQDDAATTSAGEPVTINVLSNDSDPDGDEIRVTDPGDPSNGDSDIVDGQVRYTPDEGFSGTDNFTYTITDDEGATAQAVVTVTVNAAPSLGILEQPSEKARSGVRFDDQPIIQLRDGLGRSLLISGVQVIAQVASGNGSVTGNDSTTDASGIARFTQLAISGRGDHRLAFAADGYRSVISREIDVEQDDDD